MLSTFTCVFSGSKEAENISSYIFKNVFDLYFLFFSSPSRIEAILSRRSCVIDLLFIKDDCYYIVDYKTDKVDNLEVLKDRYSIQLELYEIGVKEYYHAKKVKKFIYSIALNKYTEV